MGVQNIKQPNEVEKRGQILSALTEDFVPWMFEWLPSTVFVIYTQHQNYLILMGLHGLHPYIPAKVMRHAGKKQVIPRVTNMDAH